MARVARELFPNEEDGGVFELMKEAGKLVRDARLAEYGEPGDPAARSDIVADLMQDLGDALGREEV